MSEVIVHIGAHKTGTTAIQKYLTENTADFAAAGVTYPKTNWFHHGQHRLSFALKGWQDPGRGDYPDFDKEISELNRAIERARTLRILISSEELFSCPPEGIARLAAEIHADRLTVIAFTRRPDDLLLSMYNQKTKQPGNGFRRQLRAFVENPRMVDKDIDMLGCLSNWCDVVGQDNVLLCRYEDGDPLTVLCARLGIEVELSPPRERVVNPSLPAAAVEVMRLAKAMDWPPERQKKLFKLANRVFSGRPKTYLSDEDRLSIIAAFEKDNDALFARFGLENPYKTARFEANQSGDPRPNISFRDMMDLIDGLL